MKTVQIFIIIACVIVLVVLRLFKAKNVKVSIAEAEKEIEKLVNADYKDRGFAVFSGNKEAHFVQFAREKYGLVLTWPCSSAGKDDAEKVKAELLQSGYTFKKDISVNRNAVENLQHKEIIQDEDFLYANAGNDSKEIVSLAKSLFERIYGYCNFDEIFAEVVLKNN